MSSAISLFPYRWSFILVSSRTLSGFCIPIKEQAFLQHSHWIFCTVSTLPICFISPTRQDSGKCPVLLCPIVSLRLFIVSFIISLLDYKGSILTVILYYRLFWVQFQKCVCYCIPTCSLLFFLIPSISL